MPTTVFGVDVGMTGNNKDSAINSTNDDIALGTRDPITIRSGNIIYYISRYELSPIPANAIISSAILTVRSQVTLAVGNYMVNRLLTNWGITNINAGPEEATATQGQATWRRAFDFNGAGGDVNWGNPGAFSAVDYTAAAEDTQVTPATGATVDFNLTAMVQDMVTTPGNNFGFMIQSDVPQNNTLYSFDALAAADAPYLTVVWELPSTGITRQSHTAIHTGIAIM